MLFKSAIMQVLCEYGLADGIYKETYRELFGTGRGRGCCTSPRMRTWIRCWKPSGPRGGGCAGAPQRLQKYGAGPGAGRRGADRRGGDRPPPQHRGGQKGAACLARAHGLIVTGGSDFHGRNAGRAARWECAAPRGKRSRGWRRWRKSGGSGKTGPKNTGGEGQGAGSQKGTAPARKNREGREQQHDDVYPQK